MIVEVGSGQTAWAAVAGVEAREVTRIFMPCKGEWILSCGPQGANESFSLEK